MNQEQLPLGEWPINMIIIVIYCVYELRVLPIDFLLLVSNTIVIVQPCSITGQFSVKK